MSPEAKKQNDLLLSHPLDAETDCDFLTVVKKCEHGLAMTGVAPSRDILFRNMGRLVVLVYYVISPSIAIVIAKSEILKLLLRNLLLSPLLRIIRERCFGLCLI